MGIFILNMYAQLPSMTRVWPRHLSTFLLRASAKALVRLCIFTASSERPFLAYANSNNSISHEMVTLQFTLRSFMGESQFSKIK